MARKNRKERRKHLQTQNNANQKNNQQKPVTEVQNKQQADPIQPDTQPPVQQDPVIQKLNEQQPEPQKSAPSASKQSKFKADYNAWKEQRVQNAKNKPTRVKRLSIMGVFVSIFAVIGVIASVIFAVNATESLINQSSKKAALKSYIAPFVVTDVPEFTDDKDLSDTVKQRLAAWELLLNADLSQYPTDDYGNAFIPVVDMELYAKQLFGEDTVLKPKSDYTGSLAITYDKENSTYLLPLQPDYATYYPNITKMERNKDGYLLEVQYMTTDLLKDLKMESDPTVIKTMRYSLVKNKKNYQVTSVKLLSIEADGYLQP